MNNSMKYLIGTLLIIEIMGCRNKAIISQTAHEQKEVIDTIYGYGHVWIGPRDYIDSVYMVFLKDIHGEK